jgi:D-alanyl-D-alanine carboxypeptidase/D-alanyl-D-alanine-endopeptidase (penicillin-binding protein 4)
LAGGAAVAALACIVVSVRSSAPSEQPAAKVARIVTPLLSVRRVPEIVRDDIATARLQQALRVATANARACIAVDGPTGRLASINADVPLAPASTLKLLTAAAALSAFGPDYRFRTTVAAPAAPRGGVVDRLWLVGSGDPVLSTPAQSVLVGGDPLTRGNVVTPLAGLADAIVAAGIRSVPNGVIGDDHLFDQSRQLAAWPPRFVANGEIGALGALTVDDGFVPPGGTRAVDPALNAAAQLKGLLISHEVQVGPVGHATAPKGAVTVATVSSPPLHDIVASMLSSSDNLTAELLVRLLGTTVSSPGTTQAGINVIVDRLRGLGIDTTGVRMLDGSGLSPDDRATCNAMLAVLEHSDGDRFRALADGLSVAGVRGTLVDRFRGTPLAGHLRAKTGSLDGVTGLVGALDLHASLRFAYIANGDFSDAVGVTSRETIATVLSAYPDVALAAEVVPAPASPKGPS